MAKRKNPSAWDVRWGDDVLYVPPPKRKKPRKGTLARMISDLARELQQRAQRRRKARG